MVPVSFRARESGLSHGLLLSSPRESTSGPSTKRESLRYGAGRGHDPLRSPHGRRGPRVRSPPPRCPGNPQPGPRPLLAKLAAIQSATMATGPHPGRLGGFWRHHVTEPPTAATVAPQLHDGPRPAPYFATRHLLLDSAEPERRASAWTVPARPTSRISSLPARRPSATCHVRSICCIAQVGLSSGRIAVRRIPGTHKGERTHRA